MQRLLKNPRIITIHYVAWHAGITVGQIQSDVNYIIVALNSLPLAMIGKLSENEIIRRR